MTTPTENQDDLWERLAAKEMFTKQDLFDIAEAIYTQRVYSMPPAKMKVLARLSKNDDFVTFVSSDEYRKHRFYSAPPKSEVLYELLIPSKIRDRLGEFRKLTMPCGDSDMNRTLNQVQEGTGNSVLITAFSASFEGQLVGWSIIDYFRTKYLINVFVRKDFRKKGIGAQLVEHALLLFQQGFPGIPLISSAEPKSFWKKFPRIEHLGG